MTAGSRCARIPGLPALEPWQIHTGNLILVNASHAFLQTKPPLSPAFPLTDSSRAALSVDGYDGNPVLMQAQAARLLEHLMARLHGWREIVPVSGWRSAGEQQRIWDDSLAENGLEYTRTYVARPGHSEHETGLAIDLGLRRDNVDFICPDFPRGGICQRFRELAADYGFIQRYDEEKEDVTGIGYEPWHFRYVGIPHAAVMTGAGMALEEYVCFLREFPFGKRPLKADTHSTQFFISYISMDAAAAMPAAILQTHPFTVSGNNVDGFILTEWRV